MTKFTFGSILLSVLLWACGSSPDTVETTESAENVDAQVTKIYKMDSNAVLTWEGFKPMGSHYGTFNIKNGEINETTNGHLDGTLVIDMSSLQITDGTEDPKLKEHLAGADFFDVEKFPFSTFTITEIVENNNPEDSAQVSGNLELKGISKNITFPALITHTDSVVTVKASFFIDRTRWQMTYHSSESFGDRFIKPEVKLSLDLSARAE